MKNVQIIMGVFFIITLLSCREKTQPVVEETALIVSSVIEEPQKVLEEPEEVIKRREIDLKEFIPEGFVLFEVVKGDLNKDNGDDYVLIIKGTDEEYIIEDEHKGRGILDCNRRGIIILLSKGDQYERVVYNPSCFSSENEDGGVYYAPELYIEIKRGVLLIKYLHGRYGCWWYTFRYQNDTFELIGYDSEDNYGPIKVSQTSINFSTGKQKTSVNINAESRDDSLPEKWEVRWDDILRSPLLDLNKIPDLEALIF